MINTTSNWAGYVAIGDSGNTASFVSGNWYVPSVVCTASTNSGVLFWIGLGGISGTPVRQMGTLTYCINGQATYSAWYESYPNDPYLLLLKNVTISPGEKIISSIVYSNTTNRFTFSIEAGTQPTLTFSKTYNGTVVAQSAEWIVEPPFTPFGPAKMSNFGSVNFVNDYATVGKKTLAVQSFTQSDSAYLEASRYTCSDLSQKATPAPFAAPDLFAVTWQNSTSC